MSLRDNSDEEDRKARQEHAERRQDFIETFHRESGHRTIRHLENKFETILPHFRDPELAECDPQAATIKAAIRDGQREVIAYIKTMSQ